MPFFTQQVEVLDPIGLHARPATQIAKLVADSGLDLQIGRPGQVPVSAKSVLMLLTLKAHSGEVLQVSLKDSSLENPTSAAGEIAAKISTILKG